MRVFLFLVSTLAVVAASIGTVAAEDKPVVYLTFDDGPSHDSATRELLQLLDDYDVTATFFVVGGNVDRDPAALRAIVADGHGLGSHTQTHPNLTQLSSDQIRAQLVDSQTAVTNAGGPVMTCFRPPFGATNREVVSIASELGMSQELWSIGTFDWEREDPQIYTDIMATAEDGDVILLHDGYNDGAVTVEAVRRYLAEHRDDTEFRAMPGCLEEDEPTTEVPPPTTVVPTTVLPTTVPRTSNPTTPVAPDELPPAGPALEPHCRSGADSASIDSADPIQGAIYRIYCSHLGRQPDDVGFAYWLEISTALSSVRPLSNWFLASTEYNLTYGDLGDQAFLDTVYDNVLGREPDARGEAYWLDQLTTAGVPRSEVMLSFSESAEFRMSTGTA